MIPPADRAAAVFLAPELTQVLVNPVHPRVTVDLLLRVAAEFNDRAEAFAAIPIERVIEAIDAAIARWLQPDDRLWQTALEELPRFTGFSVPMLCEGIPRILAAFRKEGLYELVRNELPSGCRRSGRSGLLVQFLAGAVPGGAAEAIVRALLLGRPTLLKSAAHDPIFPVLLARSIFEADSRVGTGLAVLNWTGWEKDLTEAACAAAGAVVAYGGQQALGAIQACLPTGTQFVTYGPKLSFACIGREVLTAAGIEALADAAAADVGWFDQQGCVAAQGIYLERGGQVSPEGFVEALTTALTRFEARLPRGPLTPAAAAAIQTWRGRWRTAWARGVSTRLWTSPDGTQWTAVLEQPATALEPTPLNRSVKISVVDDIDEIVPLVTPVSNLLQTVGVAFDGRRLRHVEALLLDLGACRVCRLGTMQFPPAAWNHDGIGNLAPLVGAPS